jgi:2-polyprenyl-3-methyl-5-hydroxy-6-metoxy-1,4-benzoquinol methylase
MQISMRFFLELSILPGVRRDKEISTEVCEVCAGPLRARGESFLWQCQRCQFWKSTHPGSSKKINPLSPIIQEKRHRALRNLRRKEHQSTLKTLEKFDSLEGKTLLDVGCAQGWFLDEAAKKGLRGVGIEPEEEIAVVTMQQHSVRVGFFPHCLKPDEKFDVISFNDVLEHLPDISRAITQSYLALTPMGKLVLNLPDSDGFFFRLSLLLARLGQKNSLHRLWQLEYQTPHLAYFNAGNLKTLVTHHRFTLLHSQRRNAVSLKGLWERIHVDRERASLKTLGIYLGILALYPLLAWVLPKDHLLQIYQRED